MPYKMLYGDGLASLLDRWEDLPVDRIVDAYLGAPEGILQQLGSPDALDLLTNGILALAAERGWALLSGFGPDSVRLTNVEQEVTLSREGAQFVLREREDRRDVHPEIGRFTTLNAAREALWRRLR